MAKVMTTEEVDDYLDIFEEMAEERKPYEKTWEEVSELVNPRREQFDAEAGGKENGEDVGENIHDSHAQAAIDTFVRGLVGYNVGPRIRWMKLSLTNEELMELPYVKDWLEYCEKIVYKVFTNSNFYASAYQFIQDAVTIGTATMMMEDPIAHMQLLYDTRHPKETYIHKTYGETDLFARRVWMNGRALKARYTPEELGEKLLKQAEDTPMERAFDVLQFIHKAADPYFDHGMSGQRDWLSIEILRDGGKGGATVSSDNRQLRTLGYFEKPLAVWAWMPNSDESYGRSPAMNMKSELKRTNEIGLTLTKAAQLAVEKPLWIPNEFKGKLHLTPGGHNYYKRTNRPVVPIDMQSQYPIGVDVLERLYKNIDAHTYADLFEMLNRATRQMTAREINERMGEKVALLSGPLSGMNDEFLGPVVKRTFKMAARNGWIPAPPLALMNVGADIDVQFTGPLAQAQQRYHQAHNINAGLAVIGALREMQPDVLDNFDLDDLSRMIADSEGWPQTSIREIPEREQMRRARAKETERQKQMAQAIEGAKALPGLNQAPEPGSPAEAMGGQGSIPGLMPAGGV